MSRSFLWRSLLIAFACTMVVMVVIGAARAASVGQELSNVTIRDADDKPATIPNFGTHVISLTYADSSVSDVGDPMNDAMKAKNYPKDVYKGLGVANMKDSTAPNFLIRKIVKSKIEKYKSTILTDADLTLAKAWNLGDCKGKSVFVLIGKDKKIKYIKYAVKDKPWTKAEIDNVLKLMDELILKK